MTSFSERQGYGHPDAEISIREDAPMELRQAIPSLCYKGTVGLKPNALRSIVCEALFKSPDRNNWSEPNVVGEVQDLVESCAWFEVYDIIEAIYAAVLNRRYPVADFSSHMAFEADVNRAFRRFGIGWQLAHGRIEMRGTEAFELAVRQGRDDLWNAGKTTAANELHEAIRDLSRRPHPELTGAIQHAIAALECVARDTCGSKDTLGDLVQRNPNLFPRPVDDIVKKAWGWTSNYGRHLQEGQPPSFEEAELMVGVSGVLCRYVARKLPSH